MASIFESFTTLLKTLENNSIEYMVVGSVASIIYGEPRMTKDMDLVVDIQPEDAKRFFDLFPLKDYYCPPVEVLQAEFSSKGQFNLIDQATGLKIDIMLRKNTDHSKLEFKRKVRVGFWDDFQAFVATPEDVILTKLVFYRYGNSQKHIEDIRGILAQTQVDQAYLKEWVEKLELLKYWEQI